MESKEAPQNSSNNISTEDILKSLESFGNRAKSPEQDRAKASNRDSGVSESCSSYFSDPLSATSDGQSVLSDNDRSSFTSDTFSVVSDPLGVYGSSDEGDNEIHYFNAQPWDEKHSLEKEWNVLFSSNNYLQELASHALAGKLKLSKYRSIAWKLFLDCLPEEQSEWIAKTKQLRHEYDVFKQKSLIDPSKSNDDGDDSLHILHPLSLEEKSPWKQYFEDSELKAVINQDLDRLYPEMNFFHSAHIKEMMLNLLFCYVKKNESLGYKQGMHELLAPIVYVLDNDSKAHKYMEGDGFREISRCLMDPDFIEHDAFFMFCQLMEVTEAWYQQPVQVSPNDKFISQQAEPFTDPLASPPTAIVKKLNKIQDHLLRKHDPDLWIHMKELNIAPQVYGLRWIRLLFSREFPFQDVLVIWDALLAEGSHLDLVDYIYIVMLQTIRNKLMAGNYTTCMGHLMKFPRVYNDVHVYVKKALNLRGVKKSRPPSRGSSRTSSPPASVIKATQSKSAERVSTATGKQAQKKTPQHRTQSSFSALTKRYTPFMDSMKHRGVSKKADLLTDSHPKTTELVHKSPKTPWIDILPPAPRDRTDSASSTGSSSGRTMKSLGSDLKTKFTRTRSRSRESVEELEKDHQRLQIQVSELNNDVDRMQGLYLYCGRKLDSYIGLIQEEVTKDNEADRDVIYLSLAGLKQVRDLLKGTLTYRGSTTESEKDFVDIDKGIATRLQISSPNVRPATTLDDTPVPSLANFDHYDNDEDKEKSLSAMNRPIKDALKIQCGDGNGLNEQKEKNAEHDDELDSKDAIHSELEGDEATKPGECNLKEAGNEETELKHSSEPLFLETKDDHFDDKGDADSENDVGTSKTENGSPISKTLSLDSYLKEHFGDADQFKEASKITAVPCATGTEIMASENKMTTLQPCSDEPLFVAQNHGNSTVNHDKEHASVTKHMVNNHAKAESNENSKLNGKNFLQVEKSTVDNVRSGSSTPDEPLDGFVFVNKDGTARGEHGSPVRLSPTHPLEPNDDVDRFI